MEISILLIRQIASLILMGIAGYWLRKMNFISHEGSKGLTAASVYICMPCTLFISSQTDLTPERMSGYLYAVLAILGGMLFMMMGWKVPSVVHTAMSSLSGCIGPVAMLTVGILIAMLGAYLIWKVFPEQIDDYVY